MVNLPLRAPAALLAALLVIASGNARTRAADPDPATDQSKLPIEVQPTDPKAVKIVLIAGPPYTAIGRGEHEWLAGCALLAKMLQQTPGVAPVLVRDGWPKDPETLKGARAVVFYMEGGGKQSVLKHADEVQRLVHAGVGIVHLHQVIDYPTAAADRVLPWLGGVYEPKTGARGHWDGEFKAFPDHPVTRGVEPFAMNDGWIYRLRFVPDLKGVTPLARTTNPKAPAPKAGQPAPAAKPSDDVISWVYERPDGGRSFVFTGGHEQKLWGIPGFRRLVVNGILWTAKVEIPSGGAPVALNPDELMTNLDPKPAKPVKAPATKPAAVKSTPKGDAATK